MAKKLSARECGMSQAAANCYSNDCGIMSCANVVVKRGQENGEVCECTIYVGHGRYDDHNMPNVSIDWPEGCSIPERYCIHSDFDCAYVKMKYHGTGLLTIYLGEISIDINAINEDADDEVETEDE